MAIAETAQLIARLDLQNNLTPGVNRALGSLNTLQTRVGRIGSIASRGFSNLGRNLKGLVTGPLGLVGLAGGFYGLERAISDSVKAATDFHQQMELVHTQAGATQGEVDKLSGSLLDMAKAVGTTPEELAMGLFHVESAGYRGAKALEILRIAAEGAKVGNADLETVTNALVGAEQSGIKGAEDYTKAMGTLNAIVGAGNLRMQDLVDSFGSGILASARTFGVSLRSIGSALATMTDEGIPAIDASTRLRMSLSLLGAPTAKAIKLLKGIGIGQYDLAKAMRSPGGFVAAIGLLRQHMMKAGLIDSSGNPNPRGAALLSRAFGGGRSSAAIMTLVTNFSLLQAKQKAVNDGADKFGEAWAKTQQTSAFHFAQFGAVLEKVRVKIGDKLLPMITDALGSLSDWLDTHSDDIAKVFEDGAKFAGQLGGVIKDQVLPVFGMIADAWGKLPAGLQQVLVGGFVVNKLTGGAVTDIAKSLFGKMPGVGAALGATPVFVTNWPGGFGGGGGIPGVGVAAAGAGGIGLSTVAIAAAAFLAVPLIMTQMGFKAGPHGPGRGSAFGPGGTVGPAGQPKLFIDPRNLSEGNKEMVDKVANARDAIESSRIALSAKLGETRGAVASGADRIVAAIQHNRPIVHVHVGLRSTTIVKVGGTLHAVTKGIEFTGIPHG